MGDESRQWEECSLRMAAEQLVSKTCMKRAVISCNMLTWLLARAGRVSGTTTSWVADVDKAIIDKLQIDLWAPCTCGQEEVRWKEYLVATMRLLHWLRTLLHLCRS